MLTNLRGVSPLSETMSDGALESNRAEKALLTRTPAHTLVPRNSLPNVKNYSDKNGNDVTKSVHKGRRTFAFWTLVCLLFILAVGNLVLTFIILAVLRLGQGRYSAFAKARFLTYVLQIINTGIYWRNEGKNNKDTSVVIVKLYNR